MGLPHLTMDVAELGRHRPLMICARIVLADPFGHPEMLDLVIPLATGYGHTAEIAHEVLVLCITAAERPVVVDVDGKFVALPKALVRAVITWNQR